MRTIWVALVLTVIFGVVPVYAEGGEDCNSAAVIDFVPFTDTGDTSDNTHEYDEACPYIGSEAPDVVYVMQPAMDIVIDISLCTSLYDTKFYVYEGLCADGMVISCNDDACGDDGYKSEVRNVVLTGGLDYYIVIDGYTNSWGEYTLDIYDSVNTPTPCVWECPPGSIPESEPCGDDLNGGCNMPVPVYEPLTIGQVVCCTAWAEDRTRDTDWFEIVIEEDLQLTWTVHADFPVLIGYIRGNDPQGNPDCMENHVLDPWGLSSNCDIVSVTTECFSPGRYWFFAGNEIFAEYPCSGSPIDYWAELTSSPCSVPSVTPTPTSTPTPSVTSTLTPTSTLTSTPTPTPTITPTLTPPDTCPGSSIFSQPPMGPSDPFNSFRSDETNLITVYDNLFQFSGGSVFGLRWWGFDLVDDTGFPEGSKNVDFEITFYEDESGLPGTQISMETVHPDKTETGVLYMGYAMLNRYDCLFDSGLQIPANAWVSIRALYDPAHPDVVFFWLSSNRGDLRSLQHYGGTFHDLDLDTSVCLLSEDAVTPTPVQTATPEPTSGPSYPTLEIWMPSHHFPTGSTCECWVGSVNHSQYDYPNANLFVVLELYGVYYYYPTFGTDTEFLQFDFLEGHTYGWKILAPFTIQSDWLPVDNLIWYAAILTEQFRLLTPIDTWEWNIGS